MAKNELLIERREVVDIVAYEMFGPKVSKKTKAALARVGFKVATNVMMPPNRLDETIEVLEERGKEVAEEMAEKIRQSLERG